MRNEKNKPENIQRAFKKHFIEHSKKIQRAFKDLIGCSKDSPWVVP